MIAIVKRSATPEQLAGFVHWIEERGFKTHVSRGDDETIVGIIGDTSRVDPFLLESMSIIDHVQRVSEPFKKANRKFHPDDTVVDCGHGVLLGGGNFQVIAGPTLVEGPSILELARLAKQAGATMLHGGAFVLRTSPYAPQGLGEEALDLLLDASRQLDMPVVSEVMDPRDVGVFVRKGIDVMQVGSRNAQNLALLREVGKTDVPVLLKRGLSQSVDDLLLAAEYVMSEGNSQVILCERGIRSVETRTRAAFDVNAIPVLKRLTHLPVIADPSHATGYARYVRPAAFAATAAGVDGLEINVHQAPSEAWSNGAQALAPDQFADLMARVDLIRAAIAEDPQKEQA